MFDAGEKTRRIICQKAANRLSFFEAKKFGKHAENLTRNNI
jgi:hypothetical protein